MSMLNVSQQAITATSGAESVSFIDGWTALSESHTRAL